MRFEFVTAGRILFGPGVVGEAAPLARELGHSALLVTGRDPARAEPLSRQLKELGVSVSMFSVAAEPSLARVAEGLDQARAAGCDLVIGLGGGSPLDAGKAIAALLTNGGEPLDYAEVIGKGRTLDLPSAPFVAIPTTAGTGTEATRNAVLASTERRVKVSLRSPHLLPRLALVDPDLTRSMPPDVTASTGLDALTQLVEPFLSPRANPMTDAICRDGIGRVSRSLQAAYHRGQDRAAREDMALASLYGGIALANAGLGAVHGFAGPFGGMFEAPHGAVCAALLAPTLAANLEAARSRLPDSRVVERLQEVAVLLTGDEKARPEDGVAWVAALCAELRIPRLGSYGMTEADLPDLIERASVANSMRANPVALTSDEMRRIIGQAM